MTQNFEFSKMGLAPLNNLEMQEIDGGTWPDWKWVAEQIISNWDEIKQGARDGWNSVSYN